MDWTLWKSSLEVIFVTLTGSLEGLFSVVILADGVDSCKGDFIFFSVG